MVPIPTANSASNNQRGAANGASSSATSNAKSSVQKYLTNCKSLYSCIYCRTHLANHDELVSRSFQGNHGRAYLFNSVINISCGPAVQRELNTGSHAVADIFCGNCETTLGWKYEKAYVETQKYKEGKYIIELAHVVRENRHLELDKGELFFGNGGGGGGSSRLTRNHHRNSLTPSSPSQCSSPTSSSNDEANVVVVGSSYRATANDDFDEELMFPFYDDLCSSRSSYPSSLSSSHHNRMRRSLYLDSTPYDWKHSATSSSSSTSSPPSSSSTSSSPSSSSSMPPTSTVAVTNVKTTTTSTMTTATASNPPAAAATTAGQSIERAIQALSPASSSSLGSSLDLLLSASSSSSPTSPEQRQPYQTQSTTSDSNDIYNKNLNSKFNDNRHTSELGYASKRAKGDQIGADDPEETQFKFEEDKPEMMAEGQQQTFVHPEQRKPLDGKLEAGGSHLNAGIQRMGERTNTIATINTTSNLSSEIITTTANNNSTKNAGSWGNKSNHSDKAELQPQSSDSTNNNNNNNHQQPAASVSNVGALSRSNANSNSSISLDDEEFYDCYTDHDVSNIMIASDSTSTLKVAE